MEEKKIMLELTPAEVILLQELTEDMEIGYAWQRDIGKSVEEKVHAAYKKPPMTRGEFNKRVEKVKKLFQGEPSEYLMVHAEKVELNFFYQVEGEE